MSETRRRKHRRGFLWAEMNYLEANGFGKKSSVVNIKYVLNGEGTSANGTGGSGGTAAAVDPPMAGPVVLQMRLTLVIQPMAYVTTVG